MLIQNCAEIPCISNCLLYAFLCFDNSSSELSLPNKKGNVKFAPRYFFTPHFLFAIIFELSLVISVPVLELVVESPKADPHAVQKGKCCVLECPTKLAELSPRCLGRCVLSLRVLLETIHHAFTVPLFSEIRSRMLFFAITSHRLSNIIDFGVSISSLQYCNFFFKSSISWTVSLARDFTSRKS